jgi:peptide-methionine (S)-S-oxide reductase
VSRVIAGYSHGEQPDPSYFDTKDHTESLFIEFNPKSISFLDILQVWHENDFPWEPDLLRERSAIFYSSAEQQDVAGKFLRKLARTRPNCKIYVAVEPVKVFYKAEEYQQNYVAKQCKAAKEKMIAWANNETQSGLFTIVE